MRIPRIRKVTDMRTGEVHRTRWNSGRFMKRKTAASFVHENMIADDRHTFFLLAAKRQKGRDLRKRPAGMLERFMREPSRFPSVQFLRDYMKSRS